MTRPPPFRFALEPELQRRRAARDRAERTVQAARAAHRTATAARADAEAALRDADASIDRAHAAARGRAGWTSTEACHHHRYLEHLRSGRAGLAAAVQQAVAALAFARRRLEEQQRGLSEAVGEVRALEAARDRAARQHRRAVARWQDEQGADDARLRWRPS